MYYTYILYSLSRGKYYVGSCQNISERLRKHHTNHRGFTGGEGDWLLKWQETHETKQEALKREKQIKNWKSRTMIEKLTNA